MQNCIFCKISAHEVVSDIVAEDADVIVFKDIHPKAETHWLIVPKKHIHSVSAVESSDWPLVASVIKKAADVAKEKGLAGYKLVFNVGREGGQMVDHLHLHLLAGGKVELP
ncbi:MAG: HIT domain-containing protein [Parcubacteria group bacterium]|nr:HIT domain-containing protein [Parcubacteria group bacterium]